MKILFLVYHGFSEVSGISQKIHYQVKGLRENGHDVRLCYYDLGSNGHWCRFVDGRVIADYGSGPLSGLRQRTEMGSLLDYCQREGIRFVYARCFQNASPWLIRFFRKLREAGIKAVTEIPTYPYDAEFRNFEWKVRMGLKVDQLFRNRLYSEMDAVVTFSDAKEIFGQRTIRISNGVDFDSIPLHHYRPTNDDTLHLIGVAEVHPWHAFDRVMKGIGEYYEGVRQRNEGKPVKNVCFHVVGGVHPHHMVRYFTPIIEEYGIQERIVFHGQLFGKALDDVFDMCEFAVGSLGRHRSGITVIKTLKNREYATRGIPFIYSETDSDFDHQPYVMKAPADESPVRIQDVIDFVNSHHFEPAEICKTVEHLTWKIQMAHVVEAVFSA